MGEVTGFTRTQTVFLKKTTSFIKQQHFVFFSYKFPFYRIKRIGDRVRQCVAVVIPPRMKNYTSFKEFSYILRIP